MDVLTSVSYDQYSDIPNIDEAGTNSKKIIFSEEAYKKLMEQVNRTAKRDYEFDNLGRILVDQEGKPHQLQKEHGCFFVGRILEEEDAITYAKSQIELLKQDCQRYQKDYNSALRKLGYEDEASLKQALINEYMKNGEHESVIYFDYVSPEFEATVGPQGKYGAVEPTSQSYEGTIRKRDEYNSLGYNSCVMHFHAHPNYGHFETFSDQDLNTYASMEYNWKKCEVFGMLAHPIVGSPTVGLSAVMAKNAHEMMGDFYSADFYMFPNIYYLNGNEICKVGGFQKQYETRTTSKPKDTMLTDINGKQYPIVQNYQQLPGCQYVSGVGKIPGTNRNIEDESVGYVDAGFLCMPGIGKFATLDLPQIRTYQEVNQTQTQQQIANSPRTG